MISVPWPPMLAPPLAPELLLAPAEPPCARSPEFPDPLDPDAPARDCSLPFDPCDWAIDHSFFENWERPGGRPTERSSSLLQHGHASRRRNGLLGTIRISCAHQSRRVLSCSPRAHACGNCISERVYVLTWHDLCVTSHTAGGNQNALAVVALLRGVQVFPFPPLALVPNRDPGCHPGRGLTLSPRRPVDRRGHDRTAPATVHG